MSHQRRTLGGSNTSRFVLTSSGPRQSPSRAEVIFSEPSPRTDRRAALRFPEVAVGAGP